MHAPTRKSRFAPNVPPHFSALLLAQIDVEGFGLASGLAYLVITSHRSASLAPANFLFMDICISGSTHQLKEIDHILDLSRFTKSHTFENRLVHITQPRRT